MAQYQLIKMQGIAPVTEEIISTEESWQMLEAERDRLTAISFHVGGPASLTKLRYGVRAV